MWWLVKMRPSGETNEEEPFGARADDKRTWSSHSCDGSKPYFAFTLSLGKALNSHIPWSAKAMLAVLTARTKKRRQLLFRLVMRTPQVAGPRVAGLCLHPGGKQAFHYTSRTARQQSR